MTWEQIIQILMWFVPSGALWVWLRQRENRKVLAAKERNDAYKEMYDDLSGTLIDLQNENIKLYKAVRELNRTIQKAGTCKHYADCPIRDELQKSGTIDTEPRQRRQSARGQRIRADTATRSPQRSADDVSDEDAGDDTGGHRL